MEEGSHEGAEEGTEEDGETPELLMAQQAVEVTRRAGYTEEAFRRMALAAHMGEELQSALGEAGALECCAEAGPRAGFSLEAAWSLVVANHGNKERALRAGLVKLACEVARDQHSPLKARSTAAILIWSCCYGVEEARHEAFLEGGVEAALDLLGVRPDSSWEKEPDGAALGRVEAVHAASGALWHLARSSECARLIAEQGDAVGACLDRIDALEDPPRRLKESRVLAALAAGTLTLHGGECQEQVRKGGLLERVGRVAARASADSEEVSVPLVFSATRSAMDPVLDLASSPLPAVSALGCAMISQLASDSSLLPSLYNGGAVRRARSALRAAGEGVMGGVLANLARRSLRALGQEAEEGDGFVERTLSLRGWLEARGMGEREESALAATGVGLSEVEELEGSDVEALPLPLGPRRRLRAALERERKGERCLVCWEAFRDAVFAHCGHLIACSDCALLLRQRGDSCPVCRAPISPSPHKDVIRVFLS